MTHVTYEKFALFSSIAL